MRSAWFSVGLVLAAITASAGTQELPAELMETIHCRDRLLRSSITVELKLRRSLVRETIGEGRAMTSEELEAPHSVIDFAADASMERIFHGEMEVSDGEPAQVFLRSGKRSVFYRADRNVATIYGSRADGGPLLILIGGTLSGTPGKVLSRERPALEKILPIDSNVPIRRREKTLDGKPSVCFSYPLTGDSAHTVELTVLLDKNCCALGEWTIYDRQARPLQRLKATDHLLQQTAIGDPIWLPRMTQQEHHRYEGALTHIVRTEMILESVTPALHDVQETLDFASPSDAIVVDTALKMRLPSVVDLDFDLDEILVKEIQWFSQPWQEPIQPVEIKELPKKPAENSGYCHTGARQEKPLVPRKRSIRRLGCVVDNDCRAGSSVSALLKNQHR